MALKALLPLSLFVAFVLLRFGVWDDTVLCLYGDWEVLKTHPWGILSYAMVHYSTLHLVPILIILLGIALVTKGRISAWTYWLIFLSGVLSGALTFTLIASLSPSPTLTSISGASGGSTALISYCVILLMRRRPLLPILFLGLIISADYLTFSLHNTLGFYSHLSGYTLGMIFALTSALRSNKNRKLVDCKKNVISKANSSGYNSLSEEEKSIISDREKHPY